MGLMSDGFTPQRKFNPNGIINRAQFGTILSRFIWLGDNNTNEVPYYGQHLQALKRAGIMTKITNPDLKEMRGWVMLTMKRIFDLAN